MVDLDDAVDEGPLQFGRRLPVADYADRPCAYGVAAREDGRIALVHIEREDGVYDDLPGGGVDPGESDDQALVREFGEETGLIVRPGPLLARAGQYMRKIDGQRVNNRSALFSAEVVGEDAALKVEDDHTLEWVEPLDALRRLRHDSHAWAVALWLRARG